MSRRPELVVALLFGLLTTLLSILCAVSASWIRPLPDVWIPVGSAYLEKAGLFRGCLRPRGPTGPRPYLGACHIARPDAIGAPHGCPGLSDAGRVLAGSYMEFYPEPSRSALALFDACGGLRVPASAVWSRINGNDYRHHIWVVRFLVLLVAVTAALDFLIDLALLLIKKLQVPSLVNLALTSVRWLNLLAIVVAFLTARITFAEIDGLYFFASVVGLTFWVWCVVLGVTIPVILLRRLGRRPVGLPPRRGEDAFVPGVYSPTRRGPNPRVGVHPDGISRRYPTVRPGLPTSTDVSSSVGRSWTTATPHFLGREADLNRANYVDHPVEGVVIHAPSPSAPPF